MLAKLAFFYVHLAANKFYVRKLAFLLEKQPSNGKFNWKKNRNSDFNRSIAFTTSGINRCVWSASMMTTFGVKKNEYYLHAIQNQLLMDVLFEKE